MGMNGIMGQSLLFFSFCFCMTVFASVVYAGRTSVLPVIPIPQEVELTDDNFRIGEKCSVVAQPGCIEEAEYLAEMLRKATGFAVPVKAGPEAETVPDNSIVLELDKNLDLGDEAYLLEAGNSGVVVKGSAAAGVFYGIQTLIQLLPPEILGKEPVSGIEWTVPGVKIEDMPRFGWRAYMLDEARHFKGMETVKKLLDQMALHKMNRFHWHLTDDQGWRIEIKRYPLLTEIGSKRKDTQIGGWDSPERSGQPHGGFYTQEEIREIVDYAAKRHITIVPEIEMPGHASAAVAAYPEMGTSNEKIEVPVVFGKLPSAFNVAAPKVYEFLENILDEVMALFPSEVIHIGGDEVKFDQWLKSDQIKELMKREGLSGPAQVQLHFTNKMSHFIESRRRRMMGWNEILGDDLHGFIKEAGGKELSDDSGGRSLASGTIVHFWKGEISLAEKAVHQGHDIVNSLHSENYLDYTYKALPLARAYNSDPIPEGLDSRFYSKVLGSECHMWSEWVPNVERLHYQTFPRFSAYAEVGWSMPSRKDYQDFLARLGTQLKRWEIQGVGFAPLSDVDGR